MKLIFVYVYEEKFRIKEIKMISKIILIKKGNVLIQLFKFKY